MHERRDEIDAIFNVRWPTANLSKNHQANFRGTIARELLEQESDEYRAQLQQQIDDMLERDLAEFNAALAPDAGIPQDTDSKAEFVNSLRLHTHSSDHSHYRARAHFVVVVQPLLELLRNYTGFYITLVAGVPLSEDDQDFELRV